MKILIVQSFTILLLILTPCLLQSEEIPNQMNWNPSEKDSLQLDGIWDFFWKEWIEPGQALPLTKKEIYVPGIWNSVVAEEGSSSGLGYGTYRLILNSSEKVEFGGLYIHDASTAGKYFWNGIEVHKKGNPSPDIEEHIPFFSVRNVPIQIQKGENELIIQLSNYSHPKGGLWESIRIGKLETLQKDFLISAGRDFFLGGSIFIMGLYHLGLFFLRPKDRSTLWFALFCLVISFRILTIGERVLFYMFPDFSWYWGTVIEYSGFFLSPLFFFLFFWELFGVYFSVKLLYFVVFIFLTFESFLFTVPTTIFPSWNIYFYGLLGVCILFSIWILIQAIRNKKEGSVVFLIGFMIMSISVVNDSLYSEIIISTFQSFSIGLFLFIFSQSFLLSKKFSKAFQDVERMSNKLIGLDKMKDEFLANTSHELKTPLNGIIGLAESLRMGAAGPLSEDAKENLDLIAYSGKRLAHLVDDILDFSKIKNSSLSLKLQPTDLYSMVEIVFATCKSMLGGKDILIINAVKKDFPLLNADENRLQQILTNLVGNSLKFTEQGKVEVSAILEDGIAKITIFDTGIGIPHEKKEDIFLSFSQVDASISRDYGGTGLGLTITKQLVELHQGTIEVESELTKFSKFSFTIPISENQERDILGSKEIRVQKSFLPSPELIHDINTIQFQKKSNNESSTILIVDDEAINRKVLKNYMQLENYQILECRNGMEALRSVEEDGVPDLILLDVMMPGMSGYEVAHTLRQKYSLHELPILILTAKNQISDVVAGLEAGANDYLSKPFDNLELISRVKNLILLKKAISKQNKLLAIQNELGVAKKLQASILPSFFPTMKGLRFTSYYSPMEDVGGDFFDFLQPSENSLGILLADVSGHGVPAALVSAMLKIAFGTELEHASNPIQLMKGIDRKLYGKTKGSFITASYVFIDTKKNQLFHVRAGHCPLLIYKSGEKKVIESTPKGRVLGVFLDNVYTLDTIPIVSGDRVVLYTDGILEARNEKGELFGSDRLMENIKLYRELDVESWTNQLLQKVSEWIGRRTKEDDITLVVVDVV
jgi:two-component system sensor histidine kinase ChiS